MQNQESENKLPYILESKKVTTVSINNWILEHIKVNTQIKSLSSWINERYEEEFMPLQREMKKLNALAYEMEMSKKAIELIKKKNTTERLDYAQEQWIKTEGQERLKRGASLEGMLKFFNNKFNSKLSLKQFRIFVYNLKTQKDDSLSPYITNNSRG